MSDVLSSFVFLSMEIIGYITAYAPDSQSSFITNLDDRQLLHFIKGRHDGFFQKYFDVSWWQSR